MSILSNQTVVAGIGYVAAGGIGAGAAAIGSGIAPDSIKPDSDSEKRNWMIAGAAGGGIAAVPVFSAVSQSVGEKSDKKIAARKAAIREAVRTHNLDPKNDYAKAVSTLLNDAATSRATLTNAASRGILGTAGQAVKFGAAAAAGAAVGVGILTGAQAIFGDE